jgi:hypothetical protein
MVRGYLWIADATLGNTGGCSQEAPRVVSHALCIRFERRTATRKQNIMTPTRKIGVGAFLLGSVVGGAIGVSGLASAATDDTSTTATTVVDDSTTSASDTTDETDDTDDDATEPSGPHTANGITEEELTGDTATSVEAAVLAAYPDATIERMETDAEGGAYEAHVTLADGTRATVKLDESFTVTATETDEGGGCGPGGRGPGADATTDDATADTSSTS